MFCIYTPLAYKVMIAFFAETVLAVCVCVMNIMMWSRFATIKIMMHFMYSSSFTTLLFCAHIKYTALANIKNVVVVVVVVERGVR